MTDGVPYARSGQLMLAAPAGGDTWSNRVGGGEGLLAQPQLRRHTHRADQPGAIHVLEGAQPPRLALAALRAGVPGLRRRAAGHGGPHAPRAARCVARGLQGVFRVPRLPWGRCNQRAPRGAVYGIGIVVRHLLYGVAAADSPAFDGARNVKLWCEQGTGDRKGQFSQNYHSMLRPSPALHQWIVRLRLADAGFWPSPGSDMYRPGCDRSVSNLGGITCLTPIGVLFSLVFTYTGFICLIAGARAPPPPVRTEARLSSPRPSWLLIGG